MRILRKLLFIQIRDSHSMTACGKEEFNPRRAAHLCGLSGCEFLEFEVFQYQQESMTAETIGF